MRRSPLAAALLAGLILFGCGNDGPPEGVVRTPPPHDAPVAVAPVYPGEPMGGDYRLVTVQMPDGRTMKCIQWDHNAYHGGGSLDCDWRQAP